MPQIHWSHEEAKWAKICTKCRVWFYTEAKDITAAEAIMEQHFASSNTGFNGLRADCRSCQCNRSNGRVNEKHRDVILDEQDGRCKLCMDLISFKDRTARVDHCHVSGNTRGVLCNKCNLSMWGVDDAEWLAKAIAYRDRFRCE